MKQTWTATAAQQPDATRPGPDARQGAGRILRLKQGYNPNSSSVGSAIPLFLAAAVTSGAVTVFLLNLFSTAGGLLRRQRPEPAGPAADTRDELNGGS